MRQEDIHAYFEKQRDWVTNLLSDVCAIPSESGSEIPAQTFFEKKMFDINGLKVMEAPISNSIKDDPEYAYPVRNLDYTDRFNLILEKPAESGGKVLALNTHIDVVPPSAEQIDPYIPKVDEEGRLWARGACDAKGQAVAMALLCKAACELDECKNGITGHLVVEEEIGGNGTVAMLRSCPDFTADVMVNMEPTGLRIQPSIRGAIWFDFLFKGVAGHAGSSQNTSSATDKAIAAVSLLKNYHKELLAKSKDYGLFVGMPNPMPLTIGLFQAGVWPAMVPDHARIAGVLGFLPNTNKETVIEEIKEIFNREENKWISDGMTVDFVYRHNAVETDPEHWFVKGMSAACEKCGISGVPTAMTASSDGIYYQEIGIPTMAFGPGLISDAHSVHEYVKIDDVIKAAEVLYEFYRSM